MLNRNKALLVIIDVQQRILPVMHEAEAVVEGVCRLAKGFRILRAPILVTEQYREGIGPTDPRVVEAVSGPDPLASLAPKGSEIPAEDPPASFDPMDKMSFSCALHPPFVERLRASNRTQVVLCGVESHVCVLQTALHLREQGFEVHLAADAVSSRNPFHKETALRRMAAAGVEITNLETAVFEMLEAAGTPQFRAWSKVIR